MQCIATTATAIAAAYDVAIMLFLLILILLFMWPSLAFIHTATPFNVWFLRIVCILLTTKYHVV